MMFGRGFESHRLHQLAASFLECQVASTSSGREQSHRSLPHVAMRGIDVDGRGNLACRACGSTFLQS